MKFSVSIYGAHGTIPSVDLTGLRANGNTSCFLVEIDDRVIILDGGSGLVPLGVDLRKRGVKQLDVFFTHFHYDHMMGCPFFSPLFDSDVCVNVWSAGSDEGLKTGQILQEFMRSPFLPISADAFFATIIPKTFRAGDEVRFGDDIKIQTAPLNHPGGNTGYRITAHGKTFCYTGDFEHDNGAGDEELIGLLKEADLAVVDSTYTPQDYGAHAGFGHTHWEAVGTLCNKAEVKHWLLSHHLFGRTQEALNEIEKNSSDLFPNSELAREGKIYDLLSL